MSVIIEPLVVGDTVQLRSGGDNMAVEAIDGGKVVCVWFQFAYKDHDDDDLYGVWEGPYRNTFSEAALRKVELNHGDDE